MIKRSMLAIALSALSLTAHRVAAQQRGDESFLARDPAGNLIVVDDAAGFGHARQWAFSSDAALSFQRQTTTNVRGANSFPAVTSLQFAPAADYFVLENLSVGGVVALTYAKAGNGNSLRLSLGPRFGYNFEVSRLLSIWPKLGFSYAHTKNNGGQRPTAVGAPSGTLVTNTNANALAISIFIPLLFHPAPHFFAGFGPFTDTDLSGHNRSNVWGFKLTMGGWVDRESREERGAKHVEAEPARSKRP